MIPTQFTPARWSRHFVLVACLAAPLCAEEPRPTAQTPPQPSAEAKIKARQALDASFKSLDEELKAVIPEYSKTIVEAQKKGVPRDQWPKSPANDFYPRFEELALQDQPDALRWCLGIQGTIDQTIDLRNSRKDALYKRYVASSLDSQFTPDVITFLLNEAAPEGIGVDRAAAFLDQIAKGASKTDIRAQALSTKASVYQRSTKPEHKELALATYKELIAAYPKSADGEKAKGILFQLLQLQVGMTAPEVTTSDVDGKEFKLTDSRGKVTLVLFFGFQNRATPPMLQLMKEFTTSFKDKPFAIVGVSNDEKKDEFKKALAESGIDWKISWQGGPRGPWLAEWGVARVPALYLLDERGVIRLVNPDTDTLKKTLDSLFAEIEAPKKVTK